MLKSVASEGPPPCVSSGTNRCSSTQTTKKSNNSPAVIAAAFAADAAAIAAAAVAAAAAAAGVGETIGGDSSASRSNSSRAVQAKPKIPKVCTGANQGPPPSGGPWGPFVYFGGRRPTGPLLCFCKDRDFSRIR